MKTSRAMGSLPKWMPVSASILVAMFAVTSTAKAESGGCTNETLNGGYGFFVQAINLPAGTPRSILGVINFDGHDRFSDTLTFNNDGAITHATDTGTYVVNADCTGTIFTNGGPSSGLTIEIVIVDGGKEFYQLRTNLPSTFFQFNVAKKQFPGNNQGNN